MARWDLTQRWRERLARERGALNVAGGRYRLALCYPSPYKVAMASLGFGAIYRLVNESPGWAAERAFLPDAAEAEAYARGRLRLRTYESERPLGDFPVIAFSVAWELELAGVARCLDLAGVSPLRPARRDGDPVVVCGGPLTFANPRPLGALADVVVVGEAEEVLPELLEALRLAPDRVRVLEALGERPGVWLPAQQRSAPPSSDSTAAAIALPDSLGAALTQPDAPTAPVAHPDLVGAPLCVSREHLPAWSPLVTPESELTSMFLVEVTRGCSRSCRYCVMRRGEGPGMRVVPPEDVLRLVPEHARRVGLVGASVTDHPRLLEIIEPLVAGKREVGVSSLRADRLTKELVKLLRRGGQRTLTVAADGASERLRGALERHVREEHLLEAARLARDAGMRRLKLYQLIGVPGETDDDLDDLVALARELATIVPLALTVSPLVPKRRTPLADAPFGPVALIQERLRRVKAGLKGVVDVRASSPREAWLEHCVAQGGEEVGEAAVAAAAAGGRFSAWRRALAAVGVAGP